MNDEQLYQEVHYIRKRVDDLSSRLAALDGWVRIGGFFVSGITSAIVAALMAKM